VDPKCLSRILDLDFSILYPRSVLNWQRIWPKKFHIPEKHEKGKRVGKDTLPTVILNGYNYRYRYLLLFLAG
jgi:hypothetical protein